jgi:hypothetical protein
MSTKAFGRILSTHVEKGMTKGEFYCEKVIRYIPSAPFPWTWHGHAPNIEMRVSYLFVTYASVGACFSVTTTPIRLWAHEKLSRSGYSSCFHGLFGIVVKTKSHSLS